MKLRQIVTEILKKYVAREAKRVCGSIAGMSRTRKDSRQGTVLRVIKREDGTFDLILNREGAEESIPMAGLESVLCRRFGFCQDEFVEILAELDEHGRAERSL